MRSSSTEFKEGRLEELKRIYTRNAYELWNGLLSQIEGGILTVDNIVITHQPEVQRILVQYVYPEGSTVTKNPVWKEYFLDLNGTAYTVHRTESCRISECTTPSHTKIDMDTTVLYCGELYEIAGKIFTQAN